MCTIRHRNEGICRCKDGVYFYPAHSGGCDWQQQRVRPITPDVRLQTDGIAWTASPCICRDLAGDVSAAACLNLAARGSCAASSTCMLRVESSLPVQSDHIRTSPEAW